MLILECDPFSQILSHIQTFFVEKSSASTIPKTPVNSPLYPAVSALPNYSPWSMSHFTRSFC